jgi:hypothetical protein
VSEKRGTEILVRDLRESAPIDDADRLQRA